MAFRFCDQLKRVQFKEGITRIGDFAFKGCRKLGEVELPSTLESVATGAFRGTTSLYMMTCNSETPPVWEYNDIFFLHEGGISDTQIYTQRPGVFLFVPPGSEEAYRNSAFSDPSIKWTTPEGWGTAFVNFNGSALENFYITNEVDLEDVRRIANDSRFGDIQHVWLEADIEMSDTIWPTPIGSDPDRPFKAYVHGQGHTISGLRVQNDDAVGLFGYCSGNTISGIRLHDARCFSKGMAAGLVASAQDCRIDSCYIEGDAYGDTYVGGIAAKLTGRSSMDRCVCEVGINWLNSDAEPYTGGLVGYATGAQFTNCAVLTHFNTGNKSGHFVGASDASNPAVVDYCYTLNDLLTTTQFGDIRGEFLLRLVQDDRLHGILVTDQGDRECIGALRGLKREPAVFAGSDPAYDGALGAGQVYGGESDRRPGGINDGAAELRGRLPCGECIDSQTDGASEKG